MQQLHGVQLWAAALVHQFSDAFVHGFALVVSLASGEVHDIWCGAAASLFCCKQISTAAALVYLCLDAFARGFAPVVFRTLGLMSAAATTMFFWKIAAAAACQLVGAAAALVLVDTSDRLFSVSAAGARNAVLFLGIPGILVCGLVLGLRIKGMRLVSLTSRIRSGVPARFLDLLKFDFAHIVGATLVLATTTVGPRFACRAQATPRVDVDVARRCAPLPLFHVLRTHDHPAKTSTGDWWELW